MSDYVMRGTHNGRSITLELIFHGKDTIMKTGSRKFCDIFCCGTSDEGGRQWARLK